MADENKKPKLSKEAEEAADTPDTNAPAGPEPGSEEWLQQRVEIELFADDNKYSGSVFVGVNGKTFEIQRGVPVMVPRYVAEVLKHAKDQRYQAKIKSENLSKEFERNSAERGINV